MLSLCSGYEYSVKCNDRFCHLSAYLFCRNFLLSLSTILFQPFCVPWVTQTTLYYLIVCCFINVFLDIFLVVGFNLGITGAALATLFSQAVSAILVIRALMKPEEMYRFEPKNPPAPIFAFLYSYNRTSGRLSIYDVQYCQYHYSVLFKSSGNRCNSSLYCIRKNGRRILLDDFRCIFGFSITAFCRTKLWVPENIQDETEKRNCLSFRWTLLPLCL